MQLLQESNFEGVKVLKEGTGPTTLMFIEGVYAQADRPNGNKRSYPFTILESQINNYISTKVKSNQAVGELMHPDQMTINYDRVTHKVESMWCEGKDFYGKSRILNTPCGKILQGLLEGGVKMGVSTRGYGSVAKKGALNEVQNDYRLVCIDVVGDPSAPDAFVQALSEGKTQIWDQAEPDIILLEGLRSDIKKTNSRLLEQRKIEVFRTAMAKIGKR